MIPKGSFSSLYSPFLPTLSVAPLAVYSTRRLVPGYAGNIFRLNRIADAVNLDIASYLEGSPDVSGVAAYLGAAPFSRVDKLYEQMGTGFDATQVTTGSMPFFSLTNEVLGKYSVTFDGNQNTGFFNVPVGVTGSSDTITIVDVIYYESINAAIPGQLGATSGAAGSLTTILGQAQASTSMQMLMGGTSGGAFVAIGGRTRSQPQVTCAAFNGRTVLNVTDRRVVQVSSVVANVVTGTWVGGFIGKSDAGAAYALNGEWYARLIYPGVLSTTEMQTLANNLSLNFNAQQINNTRLILIGNSITQGTKATMNFNNLRQAEPLFSRRIHTLNMGIFGQTVSTQHGLIATYVALRNSAVYSKELICVGEPTNDIGNAASGNIAAPSTAGGGGGGSVGTNVFNNWTLPDVIALQAVYGAANVLVPTTLARVWSGSGTDQTQRAAAAADWRALVYANQATYGYTILDYYNAPNMSNASDTTYYADGTHPTSTGYLQLASAPLGQGLAATVNSLL